ncbi:MAG: ATP synthase F1 subunit epsilon [Lachnospiraceae bacterium]|nr:ATP synthase F1 subunit epsilon [Lachnospiraceae bacterium]
MAETDARFQVEIITPERIFYTGEATMIEFNTTEGEIGVLKHHIPLTTVLAPGIVTITDGEEQLIAAVHAGFAEILGEKVTLLAEIAEWPGEIDLNRAEAAESRARERLDRKEANLDVKRAEIALRKALVRKEVVARKGAV